MASGTYASSQPHKWTQSGTRRIVTIVSRNPRQVWSVIAVPTYWLGASSVIAAENCAESATIEIPHTTATTVTTTSGAVVRKPIASAHVALIAIATIVTMGLPTRSAATPATTQPIAPEAMVMNANTGAKAGASARGAITNAQKAPIELH